MTHSKAWRQFRAAMMAGDAAAVFATYVVADVLRCHLWMRTDWPELIDGRISSEPIHWRVLAFLPFAWPVILHAFGWYEQRARHRRWVVRTAGAASIILGLLMAALALLFVRELYPRAQIGFTVALLPATAIAARGINAWIGRWLGSRRPRTVLIVGTGRDAARMRRLLRPSALGRPVVVGHLRGSWEAEPPRVPAAAILGDETRLGPILDQHSVDEVTFAVPVDELARVMPLVAQCAEVGVTGHVLAESMACHTMPEILTLHGIPLLAYMPVRHAPEELVLKRALDLAVAIIGIALTGPIMLICAALIKLLSPGPVLFRQRRSGLNGREFWMFKFRTMSPDAEARIAEVAHLNETTGPVFKASGDPRVTRVGAFLRRWSLDELPQLFNVLLGDMSVVGPRPPLPAEVVRYDRWQRRRLSMRPGLTCLWQIMGRHRVGFDEWMRLDLFYIDHWSLKLDLRIMFRTVVTVLSGSGA